MLHHLTLPNLKSYASACGRVCDVCTELQAAGYVDMVVPSRGAAPFVHAAQGYFYLVNMRSLERPSAFPDDPDLRQAASEMRIERLKVNASGPLVNPLFLPFTADIPAGITGVESGQIRHFWTEVLAAIVRSDFTSPYYRFFSFLRNEVCELGFMSSHEWNGFSSRFIFLDTVVSGRAVVEIMDAMRAAGLNDPHFVLLADQHGSRMQSPYRERIQAEIALGRATLIGLDNLFTEDQGPAVSGIWSVTMPELMTQIRDAVPEFSATGATGAGLYYTEVRAREDGSNVETTKAIARLSRLIEMCWQPAVFDDAWIAGELEKLAEHLVNHRLLADDVTLTTARPRLLAGAKTTVTLDTSPSHALRLGHKPQVASALVKKFKAWVPPMPPSRSK